MSRGHGYVQRFVLAELDRQWALGDPWVDARTLAARLEGAAPTKQARRSVRRALRRLADDGLVELGSSAAAGRIAPARVDDVATRRARRAQASELRRRLIAAAEPPQPSAAR